MPHGDDFSTLCNVSLTRLHFLCSTQRKRSKRKCAGASPSTPCTALRRREERDTDEPVRRAFPNSPTHVVSNNGKSRFCPVVRGRAEIPSRATPLSSAGAALAYRERCWAKFVLRLIFLCGTTFLCANEGIFSGRMGVALPVLPLKTRRPKCLSLKRVFGRLAERLRSWLSDKRLPQCRANGVEGRSPGVLSFASFSLHE